MIMINTSGPHQKVGSNAQRSSSWDGLDGDVLFGEETRSIDFDFFFLKLSEWILTRFSLE